MRAVLCQMDIVWEDKPANFARVRALVGRRDGLDGPHGRATRGLPEGGAGVPPAHSFEDTLMVLPEMFATGFSMNADAVVEPEGEAGATEQFLRHLAAETDAAVLGGLVARGEGAPPGNQALAISPRGEILARYTKQRPFSLAGEDACYAAGSETVVFNWGGFRIAPFVCYDLRFPELFRRAAIMGADLFVVIANWPARRGDHWLTLLQARAIENQACVIGVNRCGRDPRASYAGRSVVIDPHGVIIADAGGREGVVVAEIDPRWPARWREEFPALRDAGGAEV